MIKVLLNTLYVGAEGAYLRLENDQVIVESEIAPAQPQKPVARGVILKVPLHHLGSIVLFGNVAASFPLIVRCAEEGRPITLMSEFGRFKARIQGKTAGNVILRKAQYDCHSSANFCLDFCKIVVAGKMQNSRQVLLRASREAIQRQSSQELSDAALHHQNLLGLLPGLQTIEEVRGIEGVAASAYFEVFDYMITSQRAGFKFGLRTRRPPRDRVNCLLSFLYSLWTNDCVSALEGVGLDPQFGILHALRPGRPGLALDLVEEFRSIILDRLCLTLINRKQLSASDLIVREGGSVLLSDDDRKKVLIAFQKRKQDEVAHPLFKEKVPLGLLPHIQARILARCFRGDIPNYIPYRS